MGKFRRVASGEAEGRHCRGAMDGIEWWITEND